MGLRHHHPIIFGIVTLVSIGVGALEAACGDSNNGAAQDAGSSSTTTPDAALANNKDAGDVDADADGNDAADAE